MKKIFFKNTILTALISIIIFNLTVFLIPNRVQASTYNQVTINANSNNNNGIDAFPESYQIMLKKLVEDTGHSNWKFKPFYTDISWDELTSSDNENKCLRNTIHQSNGSWLCPCGQQGDRGYYCTSRRIVNYYLDPRNFLTETTIFQFLDLSNQTVIPIEQIQKAVEGTYLAGSVNGVSYAQMIYDAAQESGENALSITVKIFQELGKGNTLPGMINGKDATYPNTYNFFNYGASDGEGNTQRGLAYASRAGWNTPRTALIEGAKLIANSYVKVGQNTKYTFKFDIVADNSTGLYWHQYMTNIQDPTNQAKMLFDEYLNNGWLNNELTFVIPVYKDMPAYVKLPSSLTTNDGTLYFISSRYSDVAIRTGYSSGATTIEYLKRNTPVLMLNYNENNTGWSKVRVNGREGYVINDYLTPVNTKVDTYKVPNQPGDTQLPTVIGGTNFELQGSYIIAEPGTKLSDIKAKYNVISATKDGVAISDQESLATTACINIDNTVYVVAKLGDVNGDGYITPIDYVKVVNKIMGVTVFNEVSIKAADINRNGEISPEDYVKIVNQIMGNSKIEL